MRAGELRKHGIRIKLQDQPFCVLQVLLNHQGQVVTRDELQRQIWPSDTFVDFERGLNNAVKRLREALGDSADSPHYIETLPKRGYRFIASIETRNMVAVAAVTGEIPASPRAIPKLARARLLRRAATVLAIGLALAAASLFAADAGGLRSRLLLSLRRPVIQSLAVLPIQNLSDDSAQEYFADGVTDGLISELSQISSVRVISRTSVMRYKKTDKQLPEIARELNVDGVVEGTVQRSPAGDRVRITAQLLYAPAERHIWAGIYERDLKDVFSLQQDLTQEITRQIRT